MAVPCSIVEGRDSDRDRILTFGFVCMYVCLLLQDLYKSCARGGGVKSGYVCYGMLRAAACVDESDHHTLMVKVFTKKFFEYGFNGLCGKEVKIT